MSRRINPVYDEKVRKKEVVNDFLSVFMKNGLSETSVRDLCYSINLNSGGLYTYFKSKEEAVVACADAAALRLEKGLIVPALREANDIETVFRRSIKRAGKYTSEMRLLIQVSTTPKYSELMEPTLNRLCQKNSVYTQKFAEKLNCSCEELSPYFYMCITAFTNYMTFGEKANILPQLEIVKAAVKKLKNSKESLDEKDV